MEMEKQRDGDYYDLILFSVDHQGISVMDFVTGEPFTLWLYYEESKPEEKRLKIYFSTILFGWRGFREDSNRPWEDSKSDDPEKALEKQSFVKC